MNIIASSIESHPLDRPIWSSLTTGWSAFAQGDGRAFRLDQRYGPFAAPADPSPESLNALAALIPADGELWLVGERDLPIPNDTTVLRTGLLHQMVAEHVMPPTQSIDFVPLGDADAAEMLALAQLTKPGPFTTLTHRLGSFIGVRRDGQLVAMAGERMKIDGFTEVSGVCTLPDHRGKGYAGTLMRIVAQDILARGERPFLHTYADNSTAIGLYESLGFRLRTPLDMVVLGRVAA
jgi:predicted GNAT family acetyltransferase